MRIFTLGTIGAVALTLFAEGTAFAQVPPPAPPPADPAAPPPAPPPDPVPPPPPPADTNAQVGGQAQVGMGLPNAAPPPAAAPGTSDHDGVLGHIGIGYLGRRTMFRGLLDAGTVGGGRTEIQAPVIGVRYWLDQMLGLDLGLGFATGGGSAENDAPTGGADTTVDDIGGFAFILHGGVPLALANTGHFSFQITPEMNLGVAHASSDEGGDTSLNGFHLDLGARAGAEIHFGFIGIPQLSLQGSVGLAFSLDSTSASFDPDGPIGEGKQSRSAWTLGTSVQDNPWNIFTSNVAALYYF